MHGCHGTLFGLMEKFLDAFYGAHEGCAAGYVDGFGGGGASVGGGDWGVGDGAFLDTGICWVFSMLADWFYVGLGM